MSTSPESYRQRREALLTQIVRELSGDDRFVAAWLTGSYGREDADEVSDLDLNLVVAEPYSDSLCARREQVSHQTTGERLALFSHFGQPALIHENNNNAPEGGTFTFVMYAASAVMVDWTLLPQRTAERPFQSLLLFDKAKITVSAPLEPEDLEQRKKSIAEMSAFFWMMTAVTVKYIIRRDGVFVTEWLEHLQRLIYEIERQLHGEPRKYTRGSLSQIQPGREEQIASIRRLCRRMQDVAPQVEHFTGTVPAMPLVEIESLLALVKD